MSIFLLIPQTISARIWIADHISREGREVISGQGSFDVQVCGPESLRLTGHCLYLTLDQLKRFKQAVPELFERSRKSTFVLFHSYYSNSGRREAFYRCIKSAVIQTAHNRGLSFIEKNGVKPA